MITKNAELSLITCSPGSELYSIFGHSAIRVYDSTTNADLIFNYGVFDFSTPNFYWKFIKGKLQYQLAIQHTGRFVQSYKREGRLVKEERFLLTEQEKSKMIRFLQRNYRPENRYYLYDFFYNNCSTKIWDVVKSQVSGELNFDTSIYQPQSFRDLMYPYLETVPWARLGIDILLGAPADKIATFPRQMYLPDYLSRNISHTLRNKPLNGEKKILEEERVIAERDPSKSSFNKPFLGPVASGWIFFTVIVLLTFLASRNFKKGIDLAFYTILGLLGIVLIFMWIGTNHQQMDWNLNLLWANPIGLLFVWFVLRRKGLNAARVQGILMFFAIITLLLWNIIPQDFNQTIIPFLLTIVCRSADNFIPVCCKSSIPGFLKAKG
jgi:hypothetical protein